MVGTDSFSFGPLLLDSPELSSLSSFVYVLVGIRALNLTRVAVICGLKIRPMIESAQISPIEL